MEFDGGDLAAAVFPCSVDVGISLVADSFDPGSLSLLLLSSFPLDVDLSSVVSILSPESDSFPLECCSLDPAESPLLSSPLLSPLVADVARKLLSIWFNCFVYRSGGRLLIMRVSSLVSICSYSSLMDESDEMVDVGVVEESALDSGDDGEDELSVAVVGCIAGCDACSAPLNVGVGGDELAEAIFSMDFRRSRYRQMSW